MASHELRLLSDSSLPGQEQSNPLFPAPRYMDGVRVFPNTPSIP